jgi:hypothetical protein
MAAGVVDSRNRLICVRRVNPIWRDASDLHHSSADGQCTWSAETSANQTFTSGKLKEIIDLLISQIEWFAARWNKRRVQAEAAQRTPGLALLYGAFNTAQDELTRRAALASRSLMDPPMQRRGDIKRGTDGQFGNTLILVCMT